MKKINLLIMFSLMMFNALIQVSCTTTEYLIDYNKLDKPEMIKGITILTKDGNKYVLDNYEVAENSIIGSGTVSVRNSDSQFNGTIKFSEIKYVYVKNTDTIAIITLIAAAIAAVWIIIVAAPNAVAF